MSAPASLPSHALSAIDRVAPLFDLLAVAAGVAGSVVLLGASGPLPVRLARVRSLLSVGSGSAVPAGFPVDPVAWAAIPCLLSLLAAYGLWTRRRWLVWTLAGVAGVVALLGAAAGGLVVLPLAALLSVAAGLRSLRAGRTVEQPDVTL